MRRPSGALCPRVHWPSAGTKDAPPFRCIAHRVPCMPVALVHTSLEQLILQRRSWSAVFARHARPHPLEQLIRQHHVGTAVVVHTALPAAHTTIRKLPLIRAHTGSLGSKHCI
eukprot:366260-Chlamydomonas_euryale.AAC.41